MTEISYSSIVSAVARLCREANTFLPADLRRAIEAAGEAERSPVGKAILGDVAENFTFAAQKGLPICQDTGMAVVFAELGQEVHLTGGTLEAAVNEGVAKGYTEGCLRCSVVSDPLRRENTGDNTPAILHLRLVGGNTLKLTVAPKGFGSENMTALKMFTPAATAEDIVAFIVEAVSRAGSNPCPPVVVGVGLGGTSETAALLAKQALLLPVDGENEDPYYATLERESLAHINALGIGPQGLGGSTTALSVRILPYPTHIAGLPCAVNLGCHVTRHASTVLPG
ncbi:putative fumarate hydratase subunit alpha [uncultured Eubacteriales bacterium]|uniref:Putative fumarate hydratase subunit alpha n=1 Tax=uncultured Eubacteriales bacterium TaxID=172733 RepID=A0A212IYC9_9FIRM|nr:putative fumarate hydratase subunit alpha [uncultured Eubacteriales bacterium]